MRLLLFYILFQSSAVLCQQVPLISGEISTPFWHNPASSGTWNKLSVNADVMSFSLGDIAPPTPVYAMTGDYKFGFPEDGLNYGMGASAYWIEMGDLRYINFQASANLQVKLNKTRMSIGLAPGIKTVSMGDSLQAGISGPGTQSRFNLSAGIMWYAKQFYLGFSAVQLPRSYYDELQFSDELHYTVNAGYRFVIARKYVLFPSWSMTYVDGFTSYSGLLSFAFDRPGIRCGLGWRTGALSLMLGYRLKNIELSYFAHLNRSVFDELVVHHEFRLSFRKPADFNCSTCPQW